MAARYPPAPPLDPWKKRFQAEARKYTRLPFPEGRKGKPIEKLSKKPRAETPTPPKGKWKYV